MIPPSSAVRIALFAAIAFGMSAAAAAERSAAPERPAVVQRPDPLKQVEWLIQQGNHERALENVEHYLASNPKNARGRFLKGVILSEQKKTQEAIRIYADLIQEHPDLPEPYNNLAVLQAALGRYDPARTALEMAVRVKPDYAIAHENLGDIYARMAVQSWEKAAQLDRGNKSAPLKLKQVTELLSGARR